MSAYQLQFETMCVGLDERGSKMVINAQTSWISIMKLLVVPHYKKIMTIFKPMFIMLSRMMWAQVVDIMSIPQAFLQQGCMEQLKSQTAN